MRDALAWMADAAALLGRLEQVTFACAEPAVYGELLRLLRAFHFESGKERVLLPAQPGRAPLMLMYSQPQLVGDGVPPEALCTGGNVEPNVVKRTGRPRGLLAGAPRVTLKKELLARMTPRGLTQAAHAERRRQQPTTKPTT